MFWRLVSFFSGFLFLFGVLLYSSAIVYAYGMCSLFCFSFQWVAFNVVEIWNLDCFSGSATSFISYSILQAYMFDYVLRNDTLRPDICISVYVCIIHLITFARIKDCWNWYWKYKFSKWEYAVNYFCMHQSSSNYSHHFEAADLLLFFLI